MHTTFTRTAAIAGLILLMATLPGCANKKPGEPLQMTPSASQDAPDSNHDPIEPVNRGIFQFNYVFDGVLLSPLGHIYRGVVPDFAQTGIKNALTNLSSPVVFLNSVLQWDIPNAEHTLGRFVVNSTVGIAGLFDVATRIGIPKQHNKDFGQTLGVYGVGPGPYIVIPIMGPSDVRDVVGLVVDVFTDPFNYILTTPEIVTLDVTRTIVKRVDLFPLTDRIYSDSLDPYATFRSVWQQNRAKVVRDYLGRDTGLEKEAGK